MLRQFELFLRRVDLAEFLRWHGTLLFGLTLHFLAPVEHVVNQHRLGRTGRRLPVLHLILVFEAEILGSAFLALWRGLGWNWADDLHMARIFLDEKRVAQ